MRIFAFEQALVFECQYLTITNDIVKIVAVLRFAEKIALHYHTDTAVRHNQNIFVGYFCKISSQKS